MAREKRNRERRTVEEESQRVESECREKESDLSVRGCR